MIFALFARELGNLESDSGIALQSRLIHCGFPYLILHQAAKFEVFVETLYSRKLEAVLCCYTGDEIFRCFRVAIRELEVFPWGEMIGEPRLAAFRRPPAPIISHFLASA